MVIGVRNERKMAMAAKDPTWSNLYKIGGVSALILIVYSLITMVIFVFIGGLPETAAEAFNLLELGGQESLDKNMR